MRTSIGKVNRLGRGFLLGLVSLSLSIVTPAVYAQATRKDKAGHASEKAGHKEAMVHRFRSPKHWLKVFESKERDAWQKPDVVVRALALEPDWIVADIGAGTGYFAIRFAKRVERVWASDIEQSMVNFLNRRAKHKQLTNLRAVLASQGSPNLPAPVDLIFICNTAHHIGERIKYFRNLRQFIKPEGRLVIVDFKKGNIPVGPPEHHRITPAELDQELTAAGYTRANLDTTTLAYQYIAIYQKQGT